jgi:uncharacterized protein (DUF1501 family)
MHASWDQHTNLNKALKKNCDIADQPTGALIKDLKQRGLLDSTLVVWGGEFGRTPMVEIRNTSDPDNAGRDHHPLAYSMFLAGGGIKGGQVLGKTDDIGFNIVEDKVHIHDLQATLMHCLGFEQPSSPIAIWAATSASPTSPAKSSGKCSPDTAGSMTKL